MRRLSSYRIFLTQRTEYHVRGHVCVAVRDRRTGTFIETHWALNMCLASAFPDANGKMCSISSPPIGEPLWFALRSGLHCTSPVLAIEERDHIDLSAQWGRIHPALHARLAANPSALRDTH